MKRTRADDVLSSIEFELAQGAVSYNDLGAGIQAVRQYQNKVRGEVLDTSRQPENIREISVRLFQVNEMLITIAQEINAAIQSLRVDLRNTARMSQIMSSAAPTFVPEKSSRDIEDAPAVIETNQNARRQPLADLHDAMRPDAIHVDMDARPINVPIVGGLIRRFRLAAHDLVLFYQRQLVQKQAAVNQTCGEWILHLVEMSEYQQGQIDLLSARVVSLEAQLAQTVGDEKRETTEQE